MIGGRQALDETAADWIGTWMPSMRRVRTHGASEHDGVFGDTLETIRSFVSCVSPRAASTKVDALQ
jgi:hypothetical protein